jgi:hypothetical protein
MLSVARQTGALMRLKSGFAWFALRANDPTLATMKPSRRWGTRH